MSYMGFTCFSIFVYKLQTNQLSLFSKKSKKSWLKWHFWLGFYAKAYSPILLFYALYQTSILIHYKKDLERHNMNVISHICNFQTCPFDLYFLGVAYVHMSVYCLFSNMSKKGAKISLHATYYSKRAGVRKQMS